ncbi:MAG: signal peptidase II [Clostridia bacterium]|nr:signal peptidase II [Clostridia bacterium]
MKKVALPLGLASLILIIDQVLKQLVFQRFTLGDTFVLIPHCLEFCYVHNFGSVMGIVDQARWPLVFGTALAIVACFFVLFSKKCKSGILRLAFGLIIGGGIGNLIDRLFLGFVIDFIRFPISWFNYSFNIADCAVCIGCGLMVLDLLLDTFGKRSRKVS